VVPGLNGILHEVLVACGRRDGRHMPRVSLQLVKPWGWHTPLTNRLLNGRSIIVKNLDVCERWVYGAEHTRGNPITQVRAIVY
jgi:hypothetical protein